MPVQQMENVSILVHVVFDGFNEERVGRRADESLLKIVKEDINDRVGICERHVQWKCRTILNFDSF